MRPALLTTLLVPAILLLLACGDDSSNDTSAPDASTAGQGSDAGDAGATGIVEQGIVEESKLDDAGNAVGIANANVCIEGPSAIPCATTDGIGNYSFSIPFLPVPSGEADVELAITAKAVGYLGATQLQIENSTVTVWPENQPLRTDANATAFATAAGFTYPTTTTGFVSIRLGGDTMSETLGTTATISTGGTAVYGAMDGTPDRSLTGTTLSGAIYFGNVPPGIFTVTFVHAGLTCTVKPSLGTIAGDWASDDNTLRGLAVAGSETISLTAFCHTP